MGWGEGLQWEESGVGWVDLEVVGRWGFAEVC
jgi:hypothetical protein